MGAARLAGRIGFSLAAMVPSGLFWWGVLALEAPTWLVIVAAWGWAAIAVALTLHVLKDRIMLVSWAPLPQNGDIGGPSLNRALAAVTLFVAMLGTWPMLLLTDAARAADR